MDFVDVAIAACSHTRALGIEACAVFLHAPSGRPLLVVDTMPVDDERRTTVLDKWYVDPLLTELRSERIAVGDAHTFVVPLLDPRGLLGSLRCYHAPFPTTLRRELENLGDQVSIRLTELGVTTGMAPALARLTARQLDVAQLAASGRTNQAIAEVLGLSENTVKKHLKDIYARLEISNRTALAGMLAAIVHRGTHDELPLGVSTRGDITITRCA